jgi:glycogen synthase
MKILLVASGYRPQIGGLQTAVEQIARRLQVSGESVLVVTNRYPRHLPSEEVLDGVAVRRLTFLFPRFVQLRDGRVDLFLAGLFFLPATLGQMMVILLGYRPDVVNLHFVGSPSLFVLVLQALYRFPLVVSLHGGDVEGEPRLNRFNLWVFSAITRRAAVVTACSDFLARRAAALSPHIARKCVVIRNGVDLDLFRSAAPTRRVRPYVLCVGQLESHKGFDVAVTAFAQLSGERPELDLLIGGSGSQKEALAILATMLGVAARVVFLGALDPGRIASLMRGASAVIIPSRRESLGIVALEARAAGCAIAATNVGGLAEALDGYPVQWVVPEDVDGLSRAIIALCSGSTHAGTGSTGGERSRTVVSSWDQVAIEYLQVFRGIQ